MLIVIQVIFLINNTYINIKEYVICIYRNIKMLYKNLRDVLHKLNLKHYNISQIIILCFVG